METLIAIVHILVAVVLIGLVLVQDSKGGSLGGAFGGGGSNTVLGATGAATLAQKLTRIMATLFAVTCILLTIQSARGKKSVVDALPPSAPAAAAAPATATNPENPTAATTTEAHGAAQAPAASATPAPTK